MPTAKRSFFSDFLSEADSPSTVTSPSCNFTNPLRCWMSVLLPLPVQPMSPTNSPSSMQKLTPSRARFS